MLTRLHIYFEEPGRVSMSTKVCSWLAELTERKVSPTVVRFEQLAIEGCRVHYVRPTLRPQVSSLIQGVAGPTLMQLRIDAN